MNTTGSQMGADSYSAERGPAASFPLTYWACCKTASSWTTREINDFLDKGGRQRRKHFSWGQEGEWERWKDGGGEGGSGEGIHHLVRRSISFAWFVLSKAPTMQMTHTVEIERLWSWCQEWISIWLPGLLGALNHFQLDDTFNIEPWFRDIKTSPLVSTELKASRLLCHPHYPPFFF